MIAVLQRVRSAEVRVDRRPVGAIGRGILALIGVVAGDQPRDADYIADRLLRLRIFPDSGGRMNLSVADAGGALLVVSQFTLAADTRRGRRPSFDPAADPEVAAARYGELLAALRAGPVPVSSGEFGASMEVELINDGPVTFIVDSRGARRDSDRRPGKSGHEAAP